MDPPKFYILTAPKSIKIDLWTHRESNPDLFVANEVFYHWTTGPSVRINIRGFLKFCIELIYYLF